MLTFEGPDGSAPDDFVAPDGSGDGNSTRGHRPVAREGDQCSGTWSPWGRGRARSRRVEGSAIERPRTAGAWGASDPSASLGRYR
jgi:hypothetical protein